MAYALKRSVYNLKTVDELISFLEFAFKIFDQILLDFEGDEWEYNTEDLQILINFLEKLSVTKKLIYTVAVRSFLWNNQNGLAQFSYLLEKSQKLDQITFCLVAGHKAYLNDRENQLSSKKWLKKFSDIISDNKFEKEWFLGSDNIETLSAKIAVRHSQCKLILLKTNQLKEKILLITQNYALKIDRFSIYGLWINGVIDQFAYEYLERRNVKNISLMNNQVHEFILDEGIFSHLKHDIGNQYFLLFKGEYLERINENYEESANKEIKISS